MTMTNLDEADLTNTEFSPLHYSGLSVSNTDFRNAELSGIDFRKVDSSGIKILEWQQSAILESFGFVLYPDNS
jgi:fluoroquinolone resistance protein